MITVVMTAAVGVGGVLLGALLARRNDQQTARDDLLAAALNDLVAAIADVANGGTEPAQARYASAVSRVALHAPPEVVHAFRGFQDLATTATPHGRAMLVSAVQSSRDGLGHRKARDDDLAKLLFGAHGQAFDLAWRSQRSEIDVRIARRELSRPLVPVSQALEESRSLLVDDPQGAVLSAWEALSERVVELSGRSGIPAEPQQQALSLLVDRGVLSEKTSNGILGLATMHNLAAHAPRVELTPPHAEEFLVLVDGVLFALDHDVKRSLLRAA